MNQLTEKDREMARPEIDWQQVVLSGGPPCFAVNTPNDIPNRFCGRAERWQGHPSIHAFVSLDNLLAEVLDAIEGLLITFVYENPLPPDLEETTRDAHIGGAEELLIHYGREAFVQSRVDRESLEARIRAEVAATIKGLRRWGADDYNRAIDDALAAIGGEK